jgi:hypothetical protein
VLENRPMKIAILDDYQNVALKMADWIALRRELKSQSLMIILRTWRSLLDGLRGSTAPDSPGNC